VLVKYERSFLRDLKAIKDSNIKRDLERLILQVKKADSLQEISHLKKIAGYKDYYRLKIRNYRIGIKLEEKTLIFVRVLPRRDIYKILSLGILISSHFPMQSLRGDTIDSFRAF